MSQAPPAEMAEDLAAPLGDGRRLKFGKDNSFHAELRRRVEDYFKTSGRRQRGCWRMYLKTAILLAAFAASYALLVFWAAAWWQAAALSVLLGLSMAAIGFNVQHDGGHHAYSDYEWVNRLMAMSLDMLGGSSYLWHWKHAIIHHTYANITGHDSDIDLSPWGRLSPHQKRLPYHRWQHLYLWLFYGLLAIHWHLYSDFAAVATGRIGTHRIPRPRGWDLVVFIAGKVVFFSLVFVVPLMFHPVWVVLTCYALVATVVGICLSIVFQLAHAVEEAEFPMPGPEAGRIERPWAVHQVETAVNFSRRSWLMCWLLGGLNFQIEHHLFPRICHTNYPAIAEIVEATCREYGVRYTQHESFLAGLASHYRWLRRMGQPEAA